MEWDDPTRLPLGVAAMVKNCRYTAEGVGTRFGTKKTISTAAAFSINGLAMLKYLASPDVKLPLIFDSHGSFWYESPQGSGTLVPIVDTFGLLKAAMQAQIATAYNRAWIAQSDLTEGKAKPCVLDGATKNLDPVSDKPLGVPWTAATLFRVGHVVSASTANGHLYRASAITTGISAGVEPIWPVVDGSTIVDGGVTWTETTPVMAQAITPLAAGVARVGGAGTFPVNRDVYIRITVKNAQGESVGSTAVFIINTVLNDRVQVTIPALASFPLWVQGLAGGFAITGAEVYEADVATGGAAPLDAAYHKVAGGPYALGAVLNVDAAAAGTVIPVANGAVVVPAGNICSGPRWMVVMFKNRNGYITGMSNAVPVTLNVTSNAKQLYAAQIPVGPANTAKRICAFTAAGAQTTSGQINSSAGPYHYIPEVDTFASVQQTPTVIADNVTTTATFNFVDDYLIGAPEVTNFFRKIEIPECSDIFYSQLLDRMVYTGIKGYPTGVMFSDGADPETVNLPGSLMQVGQNDGTRVVCAREMDSQLFVFKENSAHPIVPNANAEPNAWAEPTPQWVGSGPCGPRAIDIVTGFAIYAHQSGLYIKNTGKMPELILPELLRKTWPSINWASKQCVWVKIDEQAQEVLVGVPIGAGQTVPSKVIRVNYQQGWEAPVVFSTRLHAMIPNANGRKTSVDDIAANVCLIALDRNLTVSVDSRIDNRQVLFGSSTANGLVAMEVPDYYSDQDQNGVESGIDWQYQTVYTPNDALAVMLLGGISLSLLGNKGINVTAIRDDGTTVQLTWEGRQLNLGATERTFDAGASDEQNERWMIKFDNGKVKNAWAELHKCNIHMLALWGARSA